MQTMVMGSNLLERQAAQLVVIPPGGEECLLDVKPDRQRNEPLTNYAREWKPSRHAAGKQTVRRFLDGTGTNFSHPRRWGTTSGTGVERSPRRASILKNPLSSQ